MAWKTCAALLTLAISVGAWGVQEDTPDPNKQDDPEPAPIRWNSFTLGYTNISVNEGGANRLRQYASPSRGFNLQHLRYTHPDITGRLWGRLDMKGFPKNDNVQTLQLIFGRANLKFTSDDFGYYDPTAPDVQRRIERNVQGSLSYSLTPNVGLWVAYKNRYKDRSYAPPREDLATITKTWAAGIEGDVLGGHAGLVLSDSRFYDRNGEQPTSIQKRVDAFYGRQFGALNLEGVYSNTKIQQRGFHDSNVKNWGLNADWDVGPETNVGFSVRRQDLSMPNVQTAYVRKRTLVGLTIDHRFANGIQLHAGYQHKEADRLRGDQAFIDVPKWNTWDAKLNGRFGSSGLRWSVRGSWEHLNRSAVMVTEDPRNLYWDDRARFQAKLDYANERFDAYASYQYRFDQNTPRDVEVMSHHFVLGASYLFTDRTSGWLELASDTYRGTGVVDTDGYTLDWFMPSSSSVALGFDHAFTPKTSVSVALTRYVTNNDNPLGLPHGNIRSTELTATLRHQFNDRHSLELVVAPWTYRDRLYEQFDSRPTMIGLNWTMKF